MQSPRPQIQTVRPSVTLVYPGIIVRGVTDFDVESGKEFLLKIENPPSTIKFEDWFSNNDPVLDLIVNEDGLGAKVKVAKKGNCKIRIDGVGTLQINVFEPRAYGFRVEIGPVETVPLKTA